MWFDLGILPGLALTGLLLAPALSMRADNSAPVPCVVIDNGNQLTAADVQLFDQRWMQAEDRAKRLGDWASGLKDRQGWNVWGVGDDTIAMVRMFELTHGRMLEPTNGRKY